jgi:hypothetical protein
VTPLSLGIFASANQSAAATSYESIATVTVGSGGASSIDFTSIPNTYEHLQIRAFARGNTNDNIDDIAWRFNSDSSVNYAAHYIIGNGSSAFAGAATGLNYAVWMRVANNLSPSNTFGIGILDILDYKNTNKYKVGRSLSGVDNNNTTGQIMYTSSVWFSTSAITSITLLSTNSSSFRQYSSFALYGIKGA